MTHPEFVEGARRLLAHEVAHAADGRRVPAVAASTCEQLVDHLATFVGTAGARALFERSLLLTARSHAWLAPAVGSAPDSRWSLLAECMAVHEPDAVEATVELIATVTELFASFVGSSLALRILQQYRPAIFASGTKEPS